MVAMECMEDASKKEILGAIEKLSGKFDFLSETVQTLSRKTDDRFDKVDARLNKSDERVDSIEQNLLETIGAFAENVDERFDRSDQRVGRVESQMVTKNYLDDKLGDLKGDMVSLVRKEDKKVNRFVEILAARRVLATDDAKEILAFRPFP